jgi:methionyl aminopeptidase
VLNLLEESVKPGITTLELDRIAEKFIRKHNAIPAFKGYADFPNTLCASVNNEVIHGIPGNRVLNEGDIISCDIGACYKGYNGDAARTFAVGNISEKAKKLIEVTKNSFFAGLEFCREGYRVSDISHAIQEYVDSFGYGIVRDYVGHGVGASLHESPEIPNFGKPGRGARLISGMTLAIEPMINEGDYRVKCMPDGWTVQTLDGCLSAHYENTVLITNGEPEVLTLI